MAYVPLAPVKAYAKSADEDDALVESLIDAAEQYLYTAGVAPGSCPYSLYELAVKGMVLHWYDNRAAVDTSSPPDFEPGIRSVINQLKHTAGLASNLDTIC